MIELSYIEISQLVIDFGVLVMIWMVQLVVYPAFLYFDRISFHKWHTRYTSAVTIVVLPLMLTQILLSIASLYLAPTVLAAVHISFIIVAWYLTFAKAVPIHQLLDEDEGTISLTKKLLLINRYRAILWTVVFILTTVNIFKALAVS